MSHESMQEACMHARAMTAPESLVSFMSLNASEQEEGVRRLIIIVDKIEEKIKALMPLIDLLGPSDKFLVSCVNDTRESMKQLAKEHANQFLQLCGQHPHTNVECVKALTMLHRNATIALQQMRTLAMLSVPGHENFQKPLFEDDEDDPQGEE